MKRFLPYSILFILALSCETDRIIFTGPYFVRFTEAAETKKESFGSPIEIEVHQSGPAQTEEISINYKISGSAREGIDYVVLSPREQVTINKGEYKGAIKIQLINNANNILRSQDIIFALQSVTGDNLEIGQGQSAIGKTFTFTIVDDCILGGTYQDNRGSSISMTSADCEKYFVSNWRIVISSFAYRIGFDFIDNGDNTLTIPSQKAADLEEKKQTISGKGTVNPLTREVTMTIIAEDYEGKPASTYTVKPN
jgi:hypothetical protein